MRAQLSSDARRANLATTREETALFKLQEECSYLKGGEKQIELVKVREAAAADVNREAEQQQW